MVGDKEKPKKNTVLSSPESVGKMSFKICSKYYQAPMHLNIIATRPTSTFDLMCHINSSKFFPISLRFTRALLSSYWSCKQGWMNVLNHSIKLMEEFKLLPAQETRGLLLCFLTHNITFKDHSIIYQTEGKRCVFVHVQGHTGTHVWISSSSKSRLWTLGKTKR